MVNRLVFGKSDQAFQMKVGSTIIVINDNTGNINVTVNNENISHL